MRLHKSDSRKRIGVAVLAVIIGFALSACGRQDEGTLPEEEVHPVAVARFCEMDLPVPLEQFYSYALAGDWLYLADGIWDPEEGGLRERVFRSDIGGEFQWEPHITRLYARCQVVLADPEGNCILFSADTREEKAPLYLLEKYDAEGMLLWSQEYSGGMLEDAGEILDSGLLTSEGNILLFGYDGTGGRVFSFDAEGELEQIYHPNLEALYGVVEGADGHTYGYYMTEDQVKLEELGSGTQYICLFAAESVHSGGREGICLCSGEGLWTYDPSGDALTEKYRWNGEYVNVDGLEIRQLVPGGEGIRLLCHESGIRSASGNLETRVTIVSVSMESSRDYPGKESITLGNASGQQNGNSRVEELVRLYNRQSVKYRVELLPYEKSDSAFLQELEQQLMRGEGPDLLNVAWTYSGYLANKGAFEDLTEYYRASNVVKEGDICPQVQKSCSYAGQNVFVIPSYSVMPQLSNVEISPQEWTPWKYLEMLQERSLYRFPSRRYDLQQCLGLSDVAHFVDYEKKECYFDSNEFRQLLETCAEGRDVETPSRYGADGYPDVDYVLSDIVWPISGMQDYLLLKASYGNKVYIIGYPGWSGAEYHMLVNDIFAINSASENKEGAWDFLEFLLSEELQSRIDWGFPVREDVLERYVESSYAAARDYSRLFSYREEGYVPNQEDLQAMREMLERATYDHMESRSPVVNIVLEEAELYFHGDASIEDTIDKIQSRVQLYLQE